MRFDHYLVRVNLIVKAGDQDYANSHTATHLNEWFTDPSLNICEEGRGYADGTLLHWRFVEENEPSPTPTPTEPKRVEVDVYCPFPEDADKAIDTILTLDTDAEVIQNYNPLEFQVRTNVPLKVLQHFKGVYKVVFSNA